MKGIFYCQALRSRIASIRNINSQILNKNNTKMVYTPLHPELVRAEGEELTPVSAALTATASLDVAEIVCPLVPPPFFMVFSSLGTFSFSSVDSSKVTVKLMFGLSTGLDGAARRPRSIIPSTIDSRVWFLVLISCGLVFPKTASP